MEMESDGLVDVPRQKGQKNGETLVSGRVVGSPFIVYTYLHLRHPCLLCLQRYTSRRTLYKTNTRLTDP